jgi:hypothetical protein
MKSLVTMRRALEDPELFGAILPGASWAGWRVLLIASMGEELTDAERETFKALTGREREPLTRIDELWAIIGRRGGKTRAIAVLAAYLAALVDYSDILAPGERASLPIMSASVWQAGKAKQYLSGIFGNVTAFKELVENETADTISLSTRVDIEVRPASFRTARSGTCCAVIADEVAFWRSENTANPDTEILNAVRPSLATTGGLLACISSPYARRGELYNTFKRDFGGNGDAVILVAKAASRTMNPLLSERVVARAFERDPASAAAEYGGEFRTDIESFVSREVVDAAIVPDRFELPRIDGVGYVAFCDPSGGSSDDMTLAIAHAEGATVILDCVRAVRPPFSPDSVVSDFAETLKAYGLHVVTGDRYGGEWPAERFGAHGIRYESAAKPKSDLYRDVLPLLNAGRVELLDHQKLIAQLCGLERRTARGGKDSIDHAPGAHDDVANAVGGALTLAVGSGDEGRVRYADFLVDNAPVEIPARCSCVFATIAVDSKGRAGVIFWARDRHVGHPLILLDFESGFYGTGDFARISARLRELAILCKGMQAGILADDELAHQASARGFAATKIGKLAARNDLAPIAAAYVGEGKVKIAVDAHTKAQCNPLAAALDFRFGEVADPLALAALYGICAAFDETLR